VRAALKAAGASGADVAGIGFDATCSLVVLDAKDHGVTVSPTDDDAMDTIVWMDHRATDQASRINTTKHEVLKYVGGGVSPEMQTPKLLWLK
ncbi:ribulokinase, partial [Klebsiella pneumoniae]